jgi:hypothetical protein
MEHENLNTEETANSDLGAVIGSADYNKDAFDFVKSILPTDYEDRLTQFSKDKGYNANEFRLFTKLIEDNINFHSNIVRLKHYL